MLIVRSLAFFVVRPRHPSMESDVQPRVPGGEDPQQAGARPVMGMEVIEMSHHLVDRPRRRSPGTWPASSSRVTRVLASSATSSSASSAHSLAASWRRPVQHQADRRRVRHQLDRRRHHRCDHHGPGGRDGHRSDSHRERLDLTWRRAPARLTANTRKTHRFRRWVFLFCAWHRPERRPPARRSHPSARRVQRAFRTATGSPDTSPPPTLGLWLPCHWGSGSHAHLFSPRIWMVDVLTTTHHPR